ncbi:MAG: glutamine synthetase type III [Bacteroidetes bacterium]|nr:MAG: glutamine synthetase type III [Bacteroidota bacterium]
MSNRRFTALKEALSHRPEASKEFPSKVSEYFGVNVFDDRAMREYLPDDVYRSITENIEKSEKIDKRIADQVASAMRAWSISKGATHYTHWFLPLNGATAEKHDAFFSPSSDNRSVEQFNGGNLVQQEPDASSLPSGGLRNTFEARGYSAWDPSSPAFIMDKTLCIPTIFVAYTGEALDFKTPLLKTLSLIDHEATEVCQLFDRSITKVTATLGWEQEYFLVDEALYSARPDLTMTGRTLLGHAPAKGQQLEDHYFGAIAPRVMEFMREFEYEAWKLGIPAKTRHNEVAPNQFELAPVYEEANIAIDHNQLVMVVMEKVARKHKFRILFHEKPFAGVNGSGKHNNWSLATNTGKNLFSPGHTPKTNLLFLTFFVNFIKAVHTHADLLRAVIASAGNDHRLGANEAPPAIISVFIGSQLTKVLDEIEKKVKDRKMTPEEKTELKLNIGKIPQIILDNTDRNRTSPMAFTGNKFEFRAVGSAANCGPAMIALNASIANQLKEFRAELEKAMENGEEKDEAIFKLLRTYITQSRPILFEGNGYSDEWVEEAQKRGLSNLKNTPEALQAYLSEKTKKLFIENNIFSEKELEARWEIRHENYVKVIQIESRVLGDLAGNHIIPTAIRYQKLLVDNVKGLKEILSEEQFTQQADLQIYIIGKISEHISAIRKYVKEMIEKRKEANAIEEIHTRSSFYCNDVKPYLDDIRYHVDKLEILIDDEMWTLPKYREMLFIK